MSTVRYAVRVTDNVQGAEFYLTSFTRRPVKGVHGAKTLRANVSPWRTDALTWASREAAERNAAKVVGWTAEAVEVPES